MIAVLNQGSAPVAQVLRFYEYVDTGDVPGLAGLFTTDCAYHRPGYPAMEGRAAIARFYATDRVIREGRHRVEAVVLTGSEVAARGGFRGVRHDGGSVDLRFADFFTVAGDGCFSRRETFFFTPLV